MTGRRVGIIGHHVSGLALAALFASETGVAGVGADLTITYESDVLDLAFDNLPDLPRKDRTRNRPIEGPPYPTTRQQRRALERRSIKMQRQ